MDSYAGGCHCHHVGATMGQIRELDDVITDVARDFGDTSSAMDAKIAMMEVDVDALRMNAAMARSTGKKSNKEDVGSDRITDYLLDPWDKRS